MNIGIISYFVGWVLRFESFFMLLPFVTGLIYREKEAVAYLAVAVLCFSIGSLFSAKKPENNQIRLLEGFACVALSWIFMSLIGALPFVVTREIPNYVDAVFETVSGFTTTGASILTNVEDKSHCMLFWRSFTHWIGGMGIIVFVISILPMLGASSMNMIKAESTGPSVGKLVPHVKDSAKILYLLYIGITLSEMVLLIIFGMKVFDAIVLTFGTVGTGGFGVLNNSIGSYSPACQIIITVFMILSGVNYAAFFLIVTKKIKKAFKLQEVRVYLALVFAASLIITGDLLTHNSFGFSIGDALRHSFFQVASISTTTGYNTYNFELWPSLSKTVLVALMFIGSCAGSTGGGIKVSRILILMKTIKKELAMFIHPRSVKKIRMDGECIEHSVVRSTNVYIAIYLVICFFSILIVSIDGNDFTTN
ncbi:MAG: TrkH family potassium uptake protein, partial [Clostridia bacterium]|nr:TrkH family potassium uptake protein [Clostridia bacterium]